MAGLGAGGFRLSSVPAHLRALHLPATGRRGGGERVGGGAPEGAMHKKLRQGQGLEHGSRTLSGAWLPSLWDSLAPQLSVSTLMAL